MEESPKAASVNSMVNSYIKKAFGPGYNFTPGKGKPKATKEDIIKSAKKAIEEEYFKLRGKGKDGTYIKRKLTSLSNQYTNDKELTDFIDEIVDTKHPVVLASIGRYRSALDEYKIRVAAPPSPLGDNVVIATVHEDESNLNPEDLKSALRAMGVWGERLKVYSYNQRMWISPEKLKSVPTKIRVAVIDEDGVSARSMGADEYKNVVGSDYNYMTFNDIVKDHSKKEKKVKSRFIVSNKDNQEGLDSVLRSRYGADKFAVGVYRNLMVIAPHESWFRSPISEEEAESTTYVNTPWGDEPQDLIDLVNKCEFKGYFNVRSIPNLKKPKPSSQKRDVPLKAIVITHKTLRDRFDLGYDSQYKENSDLESFIENNTNINPGAFLIYINDYLDEDGNTKADKLLITDRKGEEGLSKSDKVLFVDGWDEKVVNWIPWSRSERICDSGACVSTINQFVYLDSGDGRR